MKSTMKKALSLVLSVTAMAGLLGGCDTTSKTPEIEMILVDAQDKEYVLEYTLYREVAPATVNHFIKLVENGYYNELCIHDYKVGDKMYMGGYSYVDDALVYKDYYKTVKGYKDFSHTVWQDEEKKTPLYTLRGEFAGNHYKVGDAENSGALKESFGALSMYYTAKNTAAQVYQRLSDGSIQICDYAKNSTTSLFSIALKDFGSVNEQYCTFATLKEDSVKVLENLVEKIGDDDEVAEQVDMHVDSDDIYEKDFYNTVTYNVLKSAITIKEIKVTKY